MTGISSTSVRLAKHSLSTSQTTIPSRGFRDQRKCHVAVSMCFPRTVCVRYNFLPGFFVRTSMGVLEWMTVKMSLPDMQMFIKALARVQNQFLLLDVVLRVSAPIFFCSMQVVIKTLHRWYPEFSGVFQKAKLWFQSRGRITPGKDTRGTQTPYSLLLQAVPSHFQGVLQQRHQPISSPAFYIHGSKGNLFIRTNTFYNTLIDFVYYRNYMQNFAVYLSLVKAIKKSLNMSAFPILFL